MADDLDDDLSALFGGNYAPRTVTPPASYVPVLDRAFSEPCPKCNGSKVFTSYSGRIVGPCFTCKGTGTRTFKTAPEQRAKAREHSTTRKAHSAEINQSAFAKAYPAEWQWMDGNTFAFAINMRDAIAHYGYLTDNQLAAVQRCLAAREAKLQERQDRAANAPVVSIERIEQAFATARDSGLQRLKLRLASFVFKPARSTSANAGGIYVTENDEYLGKIMRGRFIATRACTAEQSARIVAAAADPKAAAIAHGKLLGSCSCCGRTLSDPESVALGIGPICAAKWGF